MKRIIDYKFKIETDGEYKILIENNQYLDISIKNLETFSKKKRNTVLVNFSGAVTNRKKNTSVYFQGEGVAKELNLPIISISDPTFKLDPKIKLAWYLGNKDIPDLPIQIAKFLDEFAKKYNTKFILFGGSGGGFACLMQSSLLKTESSILIWSPQTDIYNYIPRIVEEYLQVSNLKKEQIQNSVRSDVINKNIKILYLENIRDNHFKEHMIPYFKNKKLTKYGNSTWITKDGKITLFCGNFGEGHVVPPRLVLLKALEILKTSSCPVMASWMLENDTDGILKKANNLEITEFLTHEALRITKKTVKNSGNKYIFAVQANDEKVEYAFYLYKNNERIKTQWYIKKSDYIVNLIEPGKYKVAYFAARENVKNKGKANSEDKTSGFFEEIVIN